MSAGKKKRDDVYGARRALEDIIDDYARIGVWEGSAMLADVMEAIDELEEAVYKEAHRDGRADGIAESAGLGAKET